MVYRNIMAKNMIEKSPFVFKDALLSKELFVKQNMVGDEGLEPSTT